MAKEMPMANFSQNQRLILTRFRMMPPISPVVKIQQMKNHFAIKLFCLNFFHEKQGRLNSCFALNHFAMR
jgi:hypothetical protein